MRLYLDDDLDGPTLARVLRHARHDVLRPADAGLSGADDAVHCTCAIRENRVTLTRNYRDFQNLHNLIMQAQGHHPGILLVRRDDNSKRNMAPQDIARALQNLAAAGLVNVDRCFELNPWQ
jgi:predicted nuclease of predicted toxin-antitoxin system